MGTGTFFSKVASVDPLANALHLPGANKYAQQEAQDANSTGAAGPYAGVTPTLAGANAGYAPGGPGANADYVPFAARAPGGVFGAAQRISAGAGAINPNYTTAQPSGPAPNLYGSPAVGAPTAQAGMNPYAMAAQKAGTQPANTKNLWSGF